MLMKREINKWEIDIHDLVDNFVNGDHGLIHWIKKLISIGKNIMGIINGKIIGGIKGKKMCDRTITIKYQAVLHGDRIMEEIKDLLGAN